LQLCTQAYSPVVVFLRKSSSEKDFLCALVNAAHADVVQW
jgi:hypothetical protein